MPYDPLRRRSPVWVRTMSSSQVHSLALSLRRRATQGDLTDRQEWLWAACISELEYRARRENTDWLRCVCELCLPPFPDGEETPY